MSARSSAPTRSRSRRTSAAPSSPCCRSPGPWPRPCSESMTASPSARCSTPDGRPGGRPLLVQRILELLAGAEARLLGGLDRDLLAGLRISALAAGPRRDDEHAEAGETHFVTRLEGGRDQIENAIHGLGRGVLVQSAMLGQLLDEVVLVYGGRSFARFALRTPTLWRVAPGSNRKPRESAGKRTKKAP